MKEKLTSLFITALISFGLFQVNNVNAESVIKLNHQYVTTISVLSEKGDMISLDIDIEKINKSINAKLISNNRILALSPKSKNILDNVELIFCANGYQYLLSLVSVEQNPDLKIELQEHHKSNDGCI
jgi:hypothetical protein